ncbi:MAG TPA: tetratricopeptide repeat protein [Roseiarcus sp.]|jgi:TolB-like protein/class 3 adenylate cyclase|nr:tetratricopeptide repeat protein [Roseiarcus sp.]
MSETRKLAAILVSDVAGYSRLAGADEDRTLARLRTLRSDLIDPIISVHHGRVVKRTGDGSIIEFRSVVDAVRCAVEIQTGLIERNAGLPPEKRIEFRVGVHLGDVVEESDGDLMGDGVNIAARLEGIAKPGAICLSEDAYRQVKGRLDLKVSDLGLTQLKNIAEPVRVYALEVGGQAHAKVATPSGPAGPSAARAPRKRSVLALSALAIALLLAAGVTAWHFSGANRSPAIASAPSAEAAHLSIVVLPFTNLSGDPTQDYFADGITENLTTDLSRLTSSFVVARNTAFAFKGKNVDARDIGKELGVRYVLEGSVQRDQNQVRVNAQLIDAKSGGHIWAERFDKPLANLFSMQDDIVASLASRLGAELMANEARRAERTPNPDSMDLYFQGMAWFNKGRNPADIARARDFFDRALALDPDNFEAVVGRACADAQAATGYYLDEEAKRLASVEANLNRVLSQSPNNARAHYCLGRVKVQTKRGAEGIAESERALALNPNLASAHAVIGLAKLFDGHPEETESHELEALRVSPYDTEADVWVAYIALAKRYLGDYEGALSLYRRAKELNPNYPTGRFNTAATLVELGRLDEARAEAQAGLALNPGFTLRRYRDGAQSDNPVFLKGRERIIEDMRKAGVPEG